MPVTPTPVKPANSAIPKTTPTPAKKATPATTSTAPPPSPTPPTTECLAKVAS